MVIVCAETRAWVLNGIPVLVTTEPPLQPGEAELLRCPTKRSYLGKTLQEKKALPEAWDLH